MQGYFNVFHFIALAALALLSVLFMLLSRGEKDPKLFKIYLLINIAATLIMGYFFMLVVDKYTKKAALTEFAAHRVLRNETVVFKGALKNTGEFSIANCDLTVKVVNNPVSKDTIAGAVFKPSGWSLFSHDERTNIAEITASVAKNIAPGQMRNFSLSMPYPPHFTNTQTITNLECR